ncbi:hypothetical protein ACFV19_30655, partial [Streptomyces griseoluteus]
MERPAQTAHPVANQGPPMLELHRRWPVADEGRRGRMASPSQAAAVPVPAPVPVVEGPDPRAETAPPARRRRSREHRVHAAVVARPPC